MLPSDIKDLITAFVLFAMFVVFGSAVSKLGFLGNGGDVETKIIFDDKNEFFLLNYLRTSIDSGTIAELILKAENDETSFDDLKRETADIMDFNFVDDYNIKILYPSGERVLGDGEFGELNEIKIPADNGGIILVKAGFNIEDRV